MMAPSSGDYKYPYLKTKKIQTENSTAGKFYWRIEASN